MAFFKWKAEKPATDYPSGLSAEQLEVLKDLQDKPGYDIFIRLLRDHAELNGNLFLGMRDHGDIRDRQGYIKALCMVIEFIPNILEQARKVDDERAKSKSDSNGQPDWRGVFGSRWWDATRRTAQD
jgi:hypothetical protein